MPSSAQCVLDAFVGRSAAYSPTLEADRQLYRTTTDSERRTELQELEKARDQTRSGLERRRELVDAGVQVRFWDSAVSSTRQAAGLMFPAR